VLWKPSFRRTYALVLLSVLLSSLRFPLRLGGWTGASAHLLLSCTSFPRSNRFSLSHRASKDFFNPSLGTQSSPQRTRWETQCQAYSSRCLSYRASCEISEQIVSQFTKTYLSVCLFRMDTRVKAANSALGSLSWHVGFELRLVLVWFLRSYHFGAIDWVLWD